MKINNSHVLQILIAVGFIAFALLDWFWIIPKGIWERSLAERFFVSSIFTVLTIILLNVLIIAWEERTWRHVKKEVYSMIQEELGIVFNLILDFVENGLMIKSSITKENAFSELCKLKEAEGLSGLSTALTELLEDKISIELFKEIAQNINNVELKYSRFLPPNLNMSLINIQRHLRLLRYAVQLHNSNIKEPIPVLGIPASVINKEKENLIRPMVSLSFKGLIEEIYNIHREGIEFSPPYLP